MSEADQVKGAGPDARGPSVGPGGGGGRGLAGVAHAGGREDKRGSEDVSRGQETKVGVQGYCRAKVSRAARAGVAGTGRPVAMATAGLVASRTRAGGATGAAGTKGSGARVSRVGFFPFDCT